VHHHDQLGAQRVQRLRHEGDERGCVDADHAAGARGWVDERPEDVEDRAHAERLRSEGVREAAVQ